LLAESNSSSDLKYNFWVVIIILKMNPYNNNPYVKFPLFRITKGSATTMAATTMEDITRTLITILTMIHINQHHTILDQAITTMGKEETEDIIIIMVWELMIAVLV
jgi:hypothetical protein